MQQIVRWLPLEGEYRPGARISYPSYLTADNLRPGIWQALTDVTEVSQALITWKLRHETR
jgi:hypothetical protein